MIVRPLARRAVETWCRWMVKRRIDLRVEGLDHVPEGGPVVIACRHFHYLYDGCVLVDALPRPVSILIAVDWIRPRLGRRAMQAISATIRWPVILRADAPSTHIPPDERRRFLRQALRETVELIQQGEVVAIFPEGYPTIDPVGTRKRDEADFLPFRPGFLRIVERAGAGRSPIPIVPAGISYRRGDRWSVALRFGAPLFHAGAANREATLRRVEEEVRRLSDLA